MKITLEQVRALNPCTNRFNNFKKQNPNFSGSLQEFLSLDNITYNDKIWICVRLMTSNQRFYWARACAFSVLEIFEAKRPDDKRVRVLLEYLNTIKDVKKLTEEQLVKIRELQNAAYAYDAAAFAATNAVDAAIDAYAYYAAYSATNAAASAASAAADRTTQEEYNLIILNEIILMEIK